MTREKAAYAATIGVAYLWYAAAIAGVLVIAAVQKAPPRTEDACSAVFGCLTPLETAQFLLAIGAFYGFVPVLLVTLALAAVAQRLTASPWWAGALTAAGTGLLGAVVVLRLLSAG